MIYLLFIALVVYAAIDIYGLKKVGFWEIDIFNEVSNLIACIVYTFILISFPLLYPYLILRSVFEYLTNDHKVWVGIFPGNFETKCFKCKSRIYCVKKLFYKSNIVINSDQLTCAEIIMKDVIN